MRALIVTPNQDSGMRRNGVELVKLKAQTNNDKEESQTNSRDESGKLGHKEKERVYEEESMSTSPMERKNHKTMRDGMGRFKSKQKRHSGLNGENMDESPARLVKRRLLENASPFKAVAGDQPRQE
ncbi:hypothetical protein Gogos_000956 [Gossypium gossypioides]|uniref:Uncharacterized protein n=1 Tax=Gossypium gossypioides TaxID=34282 RepID=A0A7J9CUC0_GOSGO|nr:hypothetical protein [Gossypium gossypioides]